MHYKKLPCSPLDERANSFLLAQRFPTGLVNLLCGEYVLSRAFMDSLNPSLCLTAPPSEKGRQVGRERQSERERGEGGKSTPEAIAFPANAHFVHTYNPHVRGSTHTDGDVDRALRPKRLEY